jgi:glutathione peroxidase-family protein
MWSLILSMVLATSEAGVPNNMTLTGVDGAKIEAKQFEGKALLFVNVASKCGYTPQYDGLQALYETYKDQGLEIVGVPCNQFGGQEPGSAEEIQTFCKVNYGVKFTLLEKQDVNGENRSQLYQTLITSDKGNGKNIRWNFEKFLVDKNGNVVGRFDSAVKPDSVELKTAIEGALK